MTIEKIGENFRKGLFKAMRSDNRYSCLCIDTGKLPIEADMVDDELFPNTAMYNHKYWREHHLEEMEKYNMFAENGENKKNFKVNEKFQLVLLSTADTEDEVFANLGFIPYLNKFHKVVLERVGQKKAIRFGASTSSKAVRTTEKRFRMN
jgi:hypothetical protein